jgi:hypothetical protein
VERRAEKVRQAAENFQWDEGNQFGHGTGYLLKMLKSGFHRIIDYSTMLLFVSIFSRQKGN